MFYFTCNHGLINKHMPLSQYNLAEISVVLLCGSVAGKVSMDLEENSTAYYKIYN